MGLKDSLTNESSKTVTLTPDQVQFLSHVNNYLQQSLNMIQQHFAASFLNYVAVEHFGYEGGKDLQFKFDPSKETDNLIIAEITEP